MTEPAGQGWFVRIFGVGPRGLVVSLALLGVAGALSGPAGLPVIHGHAGFGVAAGIVGTVLALAGAAWSVKSLPVQDRGRELVTRGAFRWVRHPLYAAFLIFFDFGLALYLDNWIYVIWATALLPLWRLNVVAEERMMADTFGEDWGAYCRRVGCLFPRIFPRGRAGA